MTRRDLSSWLSRAIARVLGEPRRAHDADRVAPQVPAAANFTRRSAGAADDRGRTGSYGFDLDLLRAAGGYGPAEGYVAHIAHTRGLRGGVVMVREVDLDEMALLQGREPGEFTRELRHLGVIVSALPSADPDDA